MDMDIYLFLKRQNKRIQVKIADLLARNRATAHEEPTVGIELRDFIRKSMLLCSNTVKQ